MSKYIKKLNKFSNSKESIPLRANNFKEKANKLYNNKYKYFDDYINQYSPIEVECPIHGKFKVIPKKHLKGFECPICNPRKIYKHTVETFMKKAKEVHGDEYEYPFIEKEIDDKFITIKHKKCSNEYKVNKLSHLRGTKCHFCYGTMKKTQEQFIEECKKVHGDKIDYTYTIYKNDASKCIFKCNVCGHIYSQSANAHIRGAGCPKCAGRAYTKEDILKNFEYIHRDRYTYLPFDYINQQQKIKIKCNKCGRIFEQTIAAHLKGQGCKFCNKSKLENIVIDLLDENNIDYIYQADRNIFEWLKRQSLDFYLPKQNIAIECQGSQHFLENHFNEKLSIIQERDKRKKELCEANNVKLVYINYFDTQDEIINKINEIIKL